MNSKPMGRRLLLNMEKDRNSTEILKIIWVITEYCGGFVYENLSLKMNNKL